MTHWEYSIFLLLFKLRIETRWCCFPGQKVAQLISFTHMVLEKSRFGWKAQLGKRLRCLPHIKLKAGDPSWEQAAEASHQTVGNCPHVHKLFVLEWTSGPIIMVGKWVPVHAFAALSTCAASSPKVTSIMKHRVPSSHVFLQIIG